MRSREVFTVSLPPEMLEKVEALRKREHRTRSELVREALRIYFARQIPVIEASPAERKLVRKGRAEYAGGESRSLDQVLHDLGRRIRPIRRKTT